MKSAACAHTTRMQASILPIATDIARGMAYIHDHDIIHGGARVCGLAHDLGSRSDCLPLQDQRPVSTLRQSRWAQGLGPLVVQLLATPGTLKRLSTLGPDGLMCCSVLFCDACVLCMLCHPVTHCMLCVLRAVPAGRRPVQRQRHAALPARLRPGGARQSLRLCEWLHLLRLPPTCMPTQSWHTHTSVRQRSVRSAWAVPLGPLAAVDHTFWLPVPQYVHE